MFLESNPSVNSKPDLPVFLVETDVFLEMNCEIGKRLQDFY
jgi:hypothetical protein